MPHKDIDYVFIPHFGVENYVPPSGGGFGTWEETNDNLVASIWLNTLTMEPDPPAPPFNPPFPLIGFIGDPVVPYNTPGLTFIPSPIPELGELGPPPGTAPGYDRAFNSRVTARYWYAPPPVPIDPPEQITEIDVATLVVLNPPQEYKQQMVGAVERTGDLFGTGTGPGVKINRSLQGNYAWRVDNEVAPLSENFGLNLVGTLITFFSSYLPLPFGLAEAWIPFLKTNGADGNKPEFFDVSTNAGFDEMVDAVNRGDFYVAMWILDLVFAIKIPGFGSEISIEWPHSSGRN